MLSSRAATFALSALLAAPLASLRADPSSPTPAPISPQAAHDLLHQLDDAFVSVFQKVAPAVVIIEAEKHVTDDQQDQSFDFYFHSPESGEGGAPQKSPESPSVHSEGSGFIVRPDGYIYTNYHVIEDSGRIAVTLRDRRRFIAKVVGYDERTDVAVLKIDAANLPVAGLLDSDTVRVGQNCFAIGIPYNLDYSFCRGVVSAKGRGNLTSTPTKPMYEDYIQTDAFINPGNSGGPLFDVDGNVMGMNTLINGVGRGLSFAIPSNMLRDVGAEIIATGHAVHPWLGITVDNPEDVPSGSLLDQGVTVVTIEADAPAYKSDLRPRDVITTVDGVPVYTAHDLQHEVLRKKVGQSVSLRILRQGKPLDIAIVTDALPADLTQIAKTHHLKARTHPSDATAYGLQFSTASQTQPVHDKLPAGVPVTGVTPGSPAFRAHIQPGDIITAVDEKPVTDSAACTELLAAHRGANGPVLFVTRGGHKASAVLDNAGADVPGP